MFVIDLHRKRLFLCILVCINSLVAKTQDELSIDEYIHGKYSVRKVSNMRWRPHSTVFAYIKGNALCADDASGKFPQQVLSISDLTIHLGITVTTFPPFRWNNRDEIILLLKNIVILYDFPGRRIKKTINLSMESENIDVSRKVTSAYTIDNNLWVTDSSGTSTPVTNNVEGITSGGTYVYREEFGTSKATFWSPTGDYLAFYENDERAIPDYPLVDFKANSASINTIKYPFAGEANQKVRVGVYSMLSNKSIFLRTDDDDQYVTNVTWSPDEKFIYIQAVNRGQDHLVLKKFDARTGDFVANLFEEKSATYVEPRFPLYFLGNNTDFIYLSRRDGFQHMYHYKSDGTLVAQVDKGRHEITAITGFDKSFHAVYYTAIDENTPTEQHLYKCNILNGATARLTKEPGTHTPAVNPGGVIIDSLSSTTVPFSVKILDEKGSIITDVHTSKNPFTGYRFPSCELMNITAADGTTKLWGGILLPADFDSTRKYPAIIYVYGGPQVQMAINNWYNNVGFIPYYLASKGYIVFFLDNRGSANRGGEFESKTFHLLGSNEVSDQLEGVKFLKRSAYVDTSRIGVYGWSYGGYMTIKLMEKAPEIFKAGVSGSPVTDWRFYEVMYGERYMGTPDGNASGYTASSTLVEANRIKGKLLIIGGGLDYKTVPLNITAFINTCIQQNVQVDYFNFPGHEHGIVGNDKGYLLEKITKYFDDNLKK